MSGEGDSNQPSASVDDDEGEEGGGETVTLKIKYLNGSKFTVNTSLGSTVEYFKEIVAQNSDVPANQQRLIYKGRFLKDHESLCSCGLKANDTINMVRLSAPQAESVSRDLFRDGLQVEEAPDLDQLAQNLYMRRDMITSDPQVRDFVDRNPEIAHMLNDRSVIRENLEAARHPVLMSNIESMPGGFDFLARLYEIVHEPLFNAETGNSIPNANPLPNPWGQATSHVWTNYSGLGGSGPLGSTSLYVGDLDANVSDLQLLKAFSQMGPIISVRVCLDSATLRSRGYGYVNFTYPQDAERAIKERNNIPLNGKPIRVMYSRRDHSGRCIAPSGVGNIFIKNLDKSIDQKALHDTFSTFGDIISCKLAVDSSGKSKGYGFVQYETEESAERAMAELNGKFLKDKKVYVGPFLKRQERDPTASTKKKTFTNVYVKHFADSTTDDDLKKAFGEFGTITSAVVMKNGDGKSKGFGFVNFDSAEDAAKAVKSLNGKTFGDRAWYVCRAQKRSERQNELKVLYGLFTSDPRQTSTAMTGTWNNEGMALLRNIFDSLVPAEERYSTELKELEEMGFCGREENLVALIATCGNVKAAVERLLGNIGQ